MKGRRFPFRLRADGQRKAMLAERIAEHRINRIADDLRAVQMHNSAHYMVRLVVPGGCPPSPISAERTRSKRYRAGSRRTKRMAGAR